jgi:hypothetical protein
MPFIKFKTNLASRPFGNDRPGGGNSNEPYQKFPNNSFEISSNSTNSVFFSNKYVEVGIGPFVPQDYQDLYLATRNSSDFPIRGGNLDFDVRTQTATRFGRIDKERIQRFFKDSPRGTTFILKQIGLQLSNPRIQTGRTIQGLSDFNLVENTRVFNKGVNLLAQVGVSGTGTHFVRHGLMPYNPLEKTYEKTVIGQSTQENRLVNLKNLKIGEGNAITNPNSLSRSSRTTATNLSISYNQNVLFQYLGGPGSVYGVGSTTIRRYETTSTEKVKYDPKKWITGYDMIGSTRLENKRIADFDDFYKTGSPGGSKYKNPNGTYAIKASGSDSLNSSWPMYFDNTKDPNKIGDYVDDQHRDIIKFVFECIDNDQPSKSTALFFRAFLSGMTDNHQAEINSFRYFGRGENFYTYQGVSRAFGFSFKLHAQSQSEMQPMYNRLNYLISQVYPDYSSYGIMRAPLVRLTIGDYLYRVAGFLENVNITIEDNSPWEIQKYSFFGLQSRQLPKLLNVQCIFKPIQDFLPKRATYTSKQDSDLNFTNSPKKSMYVPYITEYKENGNGYVGQLLYDTTPKISVPNANSNNLADSEMQANFQRGFQQIRTQDLADSEMQANFETEQEAPIVSALGRIVRNTRTI